MTKVSWARTPEAHMLVAEQADNNAYTEVSLWLVVPLKGLRYQVTPDTLVCCPLDAPGAVALASQRTVDLVREIACIKATGAEHQSIGDKGDHHD